MKRILSIVFVFTAFITTIFNAQTVNAVCGQVMVTQPGEPPACQYFTDNGSGGGVWEFSSWPACPGIGAGSCCDPASECPKNGTDPVNEDLPITGGDPGQIRNPVISKIIGQTGNSDGGILILQLLLRNGIILGLGVAGIIFVFIFIRGGYVFLTSGPDKDAHQKAAKMLTNATIGLVLVLSVFAIIYILNVLFGINIYNLTIGSIG